MNINIGCDTLKYLKIFVPGIPASKGSMSISRTGHMYPADPHLKTWSRDVRLIAMSCNHEGPVDNPISMDLTFYFGNQNTDHPNYYTRKPDIDKLIRAILDSLTGIIYDDDSRVYHVDARKVYADKEHERGALIEIRPATALNGELCH